MDDLLLKFAVFLLAAIVVVPVAKALRLGSVLGYLLAGVLIGPYMLGYLGVGDQQSLRHIAEFGVVMMLFLIGLEVKPSFLWKLRVPILGMGGLQMLFSTLLLAALALAFGEHWRSALAIGMILALSSTAIIVQTLSEQRLLATRAGRTSFSVLLFQDIAVIPILTVLPLLAMVPGGGDGAREMATPIGQWLFHQAGYLRVAATLGAVAFIVVVGHFVTDRLFRFIAATGIRDIFTAAALFIVIGVALLMESVGLSAALGTFLAGVMLADSQYRHEIELSIAPFKGVLLSLFFLSVGASIDFHLLVDDPLIVAMLVAVFVAAKFLVVFTLARGFGHNRIQALLLACVLAQGGEFAFVLFAFAQDNAILPMALTDLLTLVVTISMLITPLLMILYDLADKRYGRFVTVKARDKPAFEAHNPVIIAGYGRFNQIIGRLLMSNGFGCTILENNPRVIETLKRFGQRVHYGDATRLDLLEAAGAAHAKIIVIGLKDRDRTASLIETVRRHFPHLKSIVRAGDRIHAYQLIDARVDHFQRELFNSSLELGEKALVELGYHPHTAHRQARIFKEHDERMLLELFEDWKEDPHSSRGRQPGERYISKARALADSLVAVLRNDRYSRTLTVEHDHAWEPAPTEREQMERALREEMDDARARNVVEEAVAAAQAASAGRERLPEDEPGGGDEASAPTKSSGAQ